MAAHVRKRNRNHQSLNSNFTGIMVSVITVYSGKPITILYEVLFVYAVIIHRKILIYIY